MSSITTISSFVGDRDIPNTGDQAVADRVNFFIEKYEPDCLLAILGPGLNKLFIAESPIIADSRFDKLLNGVEYLADWNETVKWDGLKSMIVDYVYFYIMKDSATQSTGKSVVLLKSDAAFNISPAQRMVDAWNSFSKKDRLLNMFLLSKSNAGIYSEFSFLNAISSAWYTAHINEFDI